MRLRGVRWRGRAVGGSKEVVGMRKAVNPHLRHPSFPLLVGPLVGDDVGGGDGEGSGDGD